MGSAVKQYICLGAALFLLSGAASGQEIKTLGLGQDYPTHVFWGDTHLHTNLSVDAFGMGNRVLGPEEAYRFARGDEVTVWDGERAQLSRPLDFLVITDHGVNMGVLPRLESGDPALLATKLGQEWSRLLSQCPLNLESALQSNPEVFDGIWHDTIESPDGCSFYWRSWSKDFVADKRFRSSVWRQVGEIADRFNEPGVFTTFIGYEWTPSTTSERSPNLHRNVIFLDDAELTGKVLPFTVQDSDNVEDLWRFLGQYERGGGRVLAIPHNGNLSIGRMFSQYKYDGEPLDIEYVANRERWEPLYEVTQIKGDGETHPVLSPNDEFADFETLSGRSLSMSACEEIERRRGEYARAALKTGLDYQAVMGANPFKFGLVGSTDSHTALTSVEESNFWGKLGLLEPGPNRIREAPFYAASGYAAVWATENSREAIFEAMKRREVYATTGTRITLRFFGGWEYESSDAFRPDIARVGYAGGVPMGGDLTNAPDGRSPTFLIRAVKDPIGANLDRVQVIKGWRTQDGELREKIYNVALSDGREDEERGPKPVGNTVDVSRASYLNTIGSPELAVVWSDPDFEPGELSFYYVRVLEIPTPRWTAYDAKDFSISSENIPDGTTMVLQERAYSSPIWYTPVKFSSAHEAAPPINEHSRALNCSMRD